MPSRSNSKSDDKMGERIVVKLHGRIVDIREKKMVPREPYICQEESICVEDLECQVAQHLGISKFALPLFGLCHLHQEHCDWLLPSTNVRRGETLSFSLRLAFADQARLTTVAKYCAASIDYIYGQLREGFLSKSLELNESMNQPIFAKIIISDMRCQSYALGWKASELKKKLNFDSFSGPYFNGLKLLLDKSALKDYCIAQCCDGYIIQDNDIMQEKIDRQIKNDKYAYVSDVLEQVTWKNIYKCRDGKSLRVKSNDNQGLQILSKVFINI